jgi:hypothetical protein
METTFYTVDRKGLLSEGISINMIKTDDALNMIEFNGNVKHHIAKHLHTICPSGISHHGFQYLFHKPDPKSASYSIDLIFENIRQAYYPQRPSRFQSLFAFDNLNQAKSFYNKHKEEYPSSKIHEVITSNKYHKGNMNLLHQGNENIWVSYFAHLYWDSKSIEFCENEWEILLELPVTIGKKIIHNNT